MILDQKKVMKVKESQQHSDMKIYSSEKNSFSTYFSYIVTSKAHFFKINYIFGKPVEFSIRAPNEVGWVSTILHGYPRAELLGVGVAEVSL
jgi:hypothetical protein